MRATKGVAGAALATIGAVHLAWAGGSTFPASSEQALARSVTGAAAMPPRAASAVVGLGLLGISTAALALSASGADVVGQRARSDRVGLRRVSTPVCRIAGFALLARAVVPTAVLLRRLGLPEPAPEFVSLNRRVYRPLCAVLAVGLIS